MYSWFNLTEPWCIRGLIGLNPDVFRGLIGLNLDVFLGLF